MKITYKDIELHYADYGTGEKTIVLLHGFLENQTMWDYFVQEYSKTYRVITIDLLGHGQTPSHGYVHTMENQADAVYAILKPLKITKAIFMGHSMGGYVALAFAELYPEVVQGLVLQNSSSLPDSPEKKENRKRAIAAVKQNAITFVRMSIANLFSEDNRELFSQEIEDLRDQALQTPLQGIVAALEGMKGRKSREKLLHTAKFPILLILGKKDQSLPYEEHAPQAEGTPVKLVTYLHGHMAHIENRNELLKETQAFFKDI